MDMHRAAAVVSAHCTVEISCWVVDAIPV
eukprot:COSAG05_NODE_6935_length_879_cov_1.100000_1_plen_28_part_01